MNAFRSEVTVRRGDPGTGRVGIVVGGDDAHAEIFEGYPDAIICKGPNFRAIGYISQVRDDGSAVYMSLTQAFGIVTPDRVFHREGLKDCDGKTLEQLKQEGKTRGFKS